MDTSRDAGDKDMVPQGQSNWSLGVPENTTQLRFHYIHLLERLINVRNSYQEDPGREEWLVKAINTASYSAFRSCIEYGAEAEAKALLKGELEAD